MVAPEVLQRLAQGNLTEAPARRGMASVGGQCLRSKAHVLRPPLPPCTPVSPYPNFPRSRMFGHSLARNAFTSSRTPNYRNVPIIIVAHYRIGSQCLMTTAALMGVSTCPRASVILMKFPMSSVSAV